MSVFGFAGLLYPVEPVTVLEKMTFCYVGLVDTKWLQIRKRASLPVDWLCRIVIIPSSRGRESQSSCSKIHMGLSLKSSLSVELTCSSTGQRTNISPGTLDILGQLPLAPYAAHTLVSCIYSETVHIFDKQPTVNLKMVNYHSVNIYHTFLSS